jgi:hypothetical protein
VSDERFPGYPEDFSEGDAEALAEAEAALAEMAETYNASDPRQVKRQRRRRQSDADRAADFWRRVMAEPTGRREMWEHLQALGYFKPPFQMTAAGVPDQFACWYAVGLAHAGRLLYDKVFLADPGSTVLMFKENDPRWPSRKG